MATPKTVAFHTLGCKLNYSETSAIGRLFEDQGYTEVKFTIGADIYVINTCSVTDFADRKCRKTVRQALRHSPEALVVVIGCYAQLKPDEIAEIPGVDLVLGAAEKFRILDYIDGLSKSTDKGMIVAGEVQAANTFVEAFSFGDRTRSFLKVQDGCDYKCSFCTIPLARGKSRSNDIEQVVLQAKQIAEQGVKEIVLTGVNIGDFGKGPQTDNRQKGTQFIDLIRQLDQVEGISRFRISSIEPNLCNDEIIEFVTHSERFVPHFHMPLQSGSDKILKLMRRRYQRSLYADRVAKIKSLMPHCCIGVDVIVGFPGETEADFLETHQFLQDLDISYLHVFTYSERANTLAAELPEVVPVEERRRRNEMLRILSEKKKRAFYNQFLGQFREVLFEVHKDKNLMSGFTDNYIKIEAPLETAKINQIHAVQLMNILDNGHVEVNLQEVPEMSWIYY
ncbi:MAG: tRNA (N(6)-L-threonylcarbamoyladenosine(37)-C(2))-methylthiotransferase MtaB [Bacteroidota bacterium]